MSEKKNMLPTFASPAYLKEVDPGTYMLYRNIEVEVFDKEKGYPVREKVKELCISVRPLRLLQHGEDESRVVLKTVHPVTAQELKLVEVDE